MIDTTLAHLFLGIYLVALVYVILVRSCYLWIVLANAFRRLMDREKPNHCDLEMTLHSRHTIPISIIVTANDRPEELNATLKTTVNLQYPEYEVVVVINEANFVAGEWQKEWQLKPISHFFRKVIPTKEVQAIYRSQRHAFLSFVIKDDAEQWDAINVGINVARYRYVLPLSTGVQLDKDSLLHLIQPALFDPRRVVGVCGALRMASSTENRASLFAASVQTVTHLHDNVLSRLGRSKRRLLLGAAKGMWGDDALALWRRDTLLTLGGFSVGGNFELNLRMHQNFVKRQLEYQVISVWQPLGSVVALPTIKELLARNSRRRQERSLALKKHAFMMLRPQYGSLAMRLLPYAWLQSTITPWIDAIVFFLLPLGALYGVLSWRAFFLVFTIVTGSALFAGLVSLTQKAAASSDDASGPLRGFWRLVGTVLLTHVIAPPLLTPWRLKKI